MSRRYWGIIAAVGLILLAGAAASPPQGDSQGANQKRTVRDGEQAPEQPIAVRIVDLPKGVEDRGCPPNDDARKSDLCAQWKSADAAYDGVAWARRSFWAGVASILLLVWTLLETRSTARRQLRAYLDIESPKIRPCDNHESPYGRTYEVSFNIRNFGETPAFDVAEDSRFEVSPLPDVTVSDDRRPSKPVGGISRGDHQTVRIQRFIDERDFRRIRDGEAPIWIDVVIRYRDAFTPKWQGWLSRRRTAVVLDITEDCRLVMREGSHILT